MIESSAAAKNRIVTRFCGAVMISLLRSDMLKWIKREESIPLDGEAIGGGASYRSGTRQRRHRCGAEKPPNAERCQYKVDRFLQLVTYMAGMFTIC